MRTQRFRASRFHRAAGAVWIAFWLAACSTPITYEDDWLDGPFVDDACLTDAACRVSTRPGLTPADRDRPVLIAVHGFTASSYEWGEFRAHAEVESEVLVSLVTLGGHGRDVADFEKSTWSDWAAPVRAEYEALVAQGYTDVSLAGSSTGGALLLDLLSADAFDAQPPKEVFLIDPIVVPGDKMLSLARVLGPLLGNVPSDDMTEEERRHWYSNRPAETLAELYALTRHVRGELASGFRLPPGTHAKVYKTSRDEVADPVSALLIYKGLATSEGSRIDVEMLESELHVFTRLRGRAPGAVTEDDRERQHGAFDDMLARMGASVR